MAMTTVTAAGLDDEETARRLIGSWLARDTGREDGPEGAAEALPSGWSVPPAPVREVLAVTRRLALQGLAGRPRPTPGAVDLLLARVLVVDEHPSAAGWSERERAELGDWVAVLIRRFGEAGVQRLGAALVTGR
ncbi:hypothetical protein AB0O91_11755 [Kitasatospora sp. NPDC089797]|uniref:hypothetical protein n=1 Tax=Kitasatospora sp. NPDC089797 TaxID=3155298 RepID=UPI00342C0F4A